MFWRAKSTIVFVTKCYCDSGLLGNPHFHNTYDSGFVLVLNIRS